MPLSQLEQALAFREGGQTQRCHTMQYTGPYNVAIHSYNALVLLMVLYPGSPSFNLMKAILLHDFPERWTGDVPTPAKLASPTLRSAMGLLEARILEHFKIPNLYKDLTAEEQDWLNAVDLLELFIWGQEQAEIGNKTISSMNEKILKILETRGDRTPKEVSNFIDNFSWSRSAECHEFL